jgi:hypothetical protein
MRRSRWASAIVWVLSWSLLYREIFHWHHLTKTLRFNPPAPPPGSDIDARPGLPLIAVLVGSATAPPVFIALTILDRAGGKRPRTAAGPRLRDGGR